MKVAVLGLGKMGEPIARRLLDAGHELCVWNRTPERASGLVAQGATVLSSPGEAWQHAEVCVTMVLDDRALADVTGELFRRPREGAVLIDMSTVSPAASRQVAEAASAAGVAYLRAPVSGNPSVVEAGNLGIMVSGDAEVFGRMEGLLRDIGPNVFHVGEAEEARVLKLALNLMIAGNAQLIAEALRIGATRIVGGLGGSASTDGGCRHHRWPPPPPTRLWSSSMPHRSHLPTLESCVRVEEFLRFAPAASNPAGQQGLPPSRRCSPSSTRGPMTRVTRLRLGFTV
jgi:hypothetical protein